MPDTSPTAIDLTSERPIPLTQVPHLAWLPLRRAGSRLNVATLFRWSSRGCRGVRLETCRVGAQRCTTEAALRRFFEKLSDPAIAAGEARPSTERARRFEEAEKILNRAGI